MKPREYARYKFRKSGILLPLVGTKRWMTINNKTWLPFIQENKQANRAMGILVEVSGGEPEDTLALRRHVITLSRVRTTGSYWSSFKDTLTHGGQMITLSSNKITTDYCSALEKNRLLNWDKNSSQLEYQYNQPSESKVATSFQNTRLSRSFKDNHKGKKKFNYLSKFKNYKKPKKYPKLQTSETPVRWEISKITRSKALKHRLAKKKNHRDNLQHP